MLNHLGAWSGIAGLALALIFGAGPHMGLKIDPRIARFGFYFGICLLVASPVIFLIQEEKVGVGVAQTNNANSNVLNVPGSNNNIIVAPFADPHAEQKRRQMVISNILEKYKSENPTATQIPIDWINQRLTQRGESFSIGTPRGISGNIIDGVHIKGGESGLIIQGDVTNNIFKNLHFEGTKKSIEIR